MKNIKFNKEKVICVLLSGFILLNFSGCSKTNIDVPNDNQVIDENVEQNEQIIVENNEQVIENIEQNKETNENTEQTYTEEDLIVINSFNEIKDEISKKIDDSNFLDSCKAIFITIVDFIFYDGEIKGIKFDDLSEEAKQNILKTSNQIDELITSKFPNYKEDISSTTSNAFNKASELIKKGANNVNDFSKELLGEDNYNAIIDAKDDIVDYSKDAFENISDFTSNLYKDGKSKVKTWYEQFKTNEN